MLPRFTQLSSQVSVLRCTKGAFANIHSSRVVSKNAKCPTSTSFFSSSSTSSTSSPPAFHTSAQKGFDASVVSAYQKGRPDYPDAAVDALLKAMHIASSSSSQKGHSQTFPHLPLLELGCGTGKFTRVLHKGLLRLQQQQQQEPTSPPPPIPNLICADPSGMSSTSTASPSLIPCKKFLQTTAQDLHVHVPPSSVAGVIAAQAFHWFANHESLEQIARVLVPGGYFGMVWNVRTGGILNSTGSDAAAVSSSSSSSSPSTSSSSSLPSVTFWMTEFERLLDTCYEPTTPRHLKGTWRNVFEGGNKSPLFHDLQAVKGNFPQPGGGYSADEDSFLSYLLSISDISKLNDAGKTRVKALFRELMHDPRTPRTSRVNSDGTKQEIWTMPMHTEMFVIQKK